jgi:hypothetical protein
MPTILNGGLDKFASALSLERTALALEDGTHGQGSST